MRPRETGAKRRFRDRDEFGPLGAFLRLERGGTDLLIVPIERRKENAARGPESARSNTGGGVRPRQKLARRRAKRAFTGGAWHPELTLSSNRRRQRSEFRPHPKEEAMSHALATVLHRGRKAASNVMSACLASSRGSAPPEHKHGRAQGNGQSRGRRPRAGTGGPPWYLLR